jgi:hypothetical protein
MPPGAMPPLPSGLPRFARDEELAEEGPEAGQARAFEPLARPGTPAAPAGPRGAEMPSPGPAPAAPEEKVRQGKSNESVRQALKDYLAQVRDKLEQKAPTLVIADGAPQRREGADSAVLEPAEPLKPVETEEAETVESLEATEGPLNFLEELAEYLPKRSPERRKNAFLRSDGRLKLEYLKARLEGRPGLKARIESKLAPAGVRDEGPVSLQKIADAFTFMQELAAFHPDRTLGTMLQSKLNGIIRQIKE